MKYSLLLCLLAAACTPRREDTRHPADCAGGAARALRATPSAALEPAARLASHVLSARVRFTGTLQGSEGIQDYVIVAPDEFLRGDPAALGSRPGGELPLFAPAGSTALAELACREGDTFLFLLSPAPDRVAPESVRRVFGAGVVTVHAVLGAHERARLEP